MESGHDLLNALVVHNSQGEIVSASQAIEERKSSQNRNSEGKSFLTSTTLKERQPSQSKMAAAVSSPYSSQDPEYLLTGRDNTFASMELTPFTPPPSGQGPNDEDMPPFQSGFGAMANLQDIADFDRENPYNPKGPKPKLIPLPGSNWNAENIIKFAQLCDSHAIRPDFTFEEAWPGVFKAKVAFGSKALETSAIYPSKKQAKEAVCKLAMAELPVPDKKAGSKRKSSEMIGGSPAVDKSENWADILNQNAQQKKGFKPLYTEYTTDSNPIQWGCTVSVLGGPPTPFGRELGPFQSKQDAKAAAAKEAVVWLRGAGLMEQTPVKRQKKKSPTPEGTSPGGTGLTQKLGGFNMETDAPTSLPELVHNLIASLGFRQPRWPSQTVRFTSTGEPLAGSGVLVSMAAYFNEEDVAREPRLAGPLGQVERIYGQKKAKEECCRKVLSLLEEIQRSRNART